MKNVKTDFVTYESLGENLFKVSYDVGPLKNGEILEIGLSRAMKMVSQRIEAQEGENWQLILIEPDPAKVKFTESAFRFLGSATGRHGLSTIAIVAYPGTKSEVEKFLTLAPPDVPTRVFDDVKDAREWSQSLL